MDSIEKEKVEGTKSAVTINLVLHSIVIMSGTSFVFGMCIGGLNQPSQHIKEYFKDAYIRRYGKEPSDFIVTSLWSATNAAIFPAGMIGSLLSSLPADRFGRKRAVMVSHAPTILGCLLQTICFPCDLPELLVIGRIIQGIGCGLYAALCPTYLTEIAPIQFRGAIGSMYQVSYAFGILVASSLGLQELLGKSNLWFYIMPLSLVPVAISFLLLPMYPESPRYLMLYRHNKDEATRALRFLREMSDVSDEITEMETETIEGEKRTKMTFWEMINTQHLRTPLIIVCCLQIMQPLTGISVILFYSRTIFKVAGVPQSYVQYSVVGVNAIFLIMSAFGAVLMDKAGRRRLLLISLSIMMTNLAILTVAMKLQNNYQVMSYLSIVSATIFVGVYAVGLGNVVILIGSEMFRQGPRAIAMSCAGMTRWCFFFVVMMSFELIQNVLNELSLLIFLIASILWLVFIYFKVPETKHRTFEEIANLYE